MPQEVSGVDSLRHQQCPKCLTFNPTRARRCEACRAPLGGAGGFRLSRIAISAIGGSVVLAAGVAFVILRGVGEDSPAETDPPAAVTAGFDAETPSFDSPPAALPPAPSIRSVEAGGILSSRDSASRVGAADSAEPAFLRHSGRIPGSRVYVFVVRGLTSSGEVVQEGSALLLPEVREALVSLRTLYGIDSAEAFLEGSSRAFPVERVLAVDPLTDLARIRIGGEGELPSGLSSPEPDEFPGTESGFRLWVADPVVPPPGSLLRGELRLMERVVDPSSLNFWSLAGAAPAVGGALLDGKGRIVGVLHPSFPWEEKRLATPLPGLLFEGEEGGGISLRELNQSRYVGSSRQLLEGALQAWVDGDAERAYRGFADLLRVEPAKGEPYIDRIAESFVTASNAARGRGDLPAALAILEEGVFLLPELPRLRTQWGRLLLEDGRDLEAVEQFLLVLDQDPSRISDLRRTIVDALLRVGDRELRGGRHEEAYSLARRGVDLFPDEASLLFLFGRVLLADQNYADAGSVLERALGLDPSLNSAIRPLLEEVDRGLGGGPVVEIRYPPDARRIAVELRVADRWDELFIIDTGATNTVLTPAAVGRLGLPLDTEYQVQVSTAGGRVQAPLVRIPSLELKGLRVVDLEAVVLELGDPKVSGLLGLDFLNHFVYSVDAREGRLTLRTR